MPFLELKITLDDRDARAMLDRLVAVGKDTNVLQSMGASLVQNTRETFRNAADPFGRSWVPLAAATLDRRKRRGNLSIQPGIDRGDMYASMDLEISGQSMLVSLGVEDARAIYFQEGGANQPARPYFPSEEEGFPDEWVDGLIAPLAAAYETAQGAP